MNNKEEKEEAVMVVVRMKLLPQVRGPGWSCAVQLDSVFQVLSTPAL